MTYRKKLIEVALPLEAINVASAREKSIRHGHPSTLHLWWARRPLAACRAVLFSSLVDDPGEYITDEEAAHVERERLFALIEKLVKWENTNDEEVLDLAAAKSELGEREERVPVRLDQAVERVAQRFQVPAQEAQIDLAWQCEGRDQPPTVLATPEGIDRILNNLLSNAIKYTPKGGRVTVTLSSGGGSVDLEVMDTGIGIPAEAVPHIFEEFYRAPNAKAQEKEGTGLGLAITKDLVRRYGGEIGVWSAVGQGTVFSVTFPLLSEKVGNKFG